MIQNAKLTWGKFKAMTDGHPSWLVRWMPIKNGYIVITGESLLTVECVVAKPDVAEFDAGIKIRPGSEEDSNVNDAKAVILGYTGRKFVSRGKSFTCTKTTSTNCDLVILGAFEVEGMSFWWDKTVAGDKAHMQVIDIDDVLGFGANYVCVQYGFDYPLRPGSGADVIVTGTRGSFPAGLYLRAVVVSLGTVDDVEFGVNYRLRE